MGTALHCAGVFQQAAPPRDARSKGSGTLTRPSCSARLGRNVVAVPEPAHEFKVLRCKPYVVRRDGPRPYPDRQAPRTTTAATTAQESERTDELCGNCVANEATVERSGQQMH